MIRDTMGIILTSNDRIPPITDIRANQHFLSQEDTE